MCASVITRHLPPRKMPMRCGIAMLPPPTELIRERSQIDILPKGASGGKCAFQSRRRFGVRKGEIDQKIEPSGESIVNILARLVAMMATPSYVSIC